MNTAQHISAGSVVVEACEVDLELGRIPLREERVSHRPFGASDRCSSFTPERVAIETDDGTVLEALDQQRASFAGHTPETPWSHDYDVEISGGTSAAHYVSDYDDVAGIRIPTKHRIFPRNPDGRSLTEPLIVSIDLSEIAFTSDTRQSTTDLLQARPSA